MPFEPWLQTQKGMATESEQGMSHDDTRYAKGKKKESKERVKTAFAGNDSWKRNLKIAMETLDDYQKKISSRHGEVFGADFDTLQSAKFQDCTQIPTVSVKNLNPCSIGMK